MSNNMQECARCGEEYDEEELEYIESIDGCGWVCEDCAIDCKISNQKWYQNQINESNLMIDDYYKKQG